MTRVSIAIRSLTIESAVSVASSGRSQSDQPSLSSGDDRGRDQSGHLEAEGEACRPFVHGHLPFIGREGRVA